MSADKLINSWDVQQASDAPMIDTVGSHGWQVVYRGTKYERVRTQAEIDASKYSKDRKTEPYKTFADAVRAAERLAGQKYPNGWARASGKYMGGWFPVGTVVKGVKFVPGVPCTEVCSQYDGRWSSHWICGKVAKESGMCGLHEGARKRRDANDAARAEESRLRHEAWDREIEARKAAREVRDQIIALLEDEFAQLDKLLTVSGDGNLKIAPEILLTLAQSHDAFRNT